ncbi:prenyltransferase/squalene oxidase repeat-containing protein [Streptomyces sp. NPDC001920]
MTGYVCCALSELHDVSPHASLATRRLIARQRPDGGWAYNTAVPSDADSTAWAVTALTTVPRWRPSALLRAATYLTRHQDPQTGGISTYDSADGIERFIGAEPEMVTGWTQPHLCVTASTVTALAALRGPDDNVVSRGASYVRDTRDDDGLWRSYWWPGITYPTYIALKALASARRVDAGLMRNTRDALCERAEAEGAWSGCPEVGPSAFATALALRTLLFGGSTQCEVLVWAVRHLLDVQLDDGSWPAEPILRIPSANVMTPDKQGQWLTDALGTGVLVSDFNQVFGTATVVNALARYRELTAQ